MKKFALTLLGLYFICGLYSQETIKLESEKEAIVSAIEAAKKGFNDKNMELIKLNVLNDSRFIEVGTGMFGEWLTRGFSKHEKGIYSLWDNELILHRETSVELVDLELYDDAAFAVIEVDWQLTTNKGIENLKHIETVFLVKESDKWKIAGSHLYYLNNPIRKIGIIGSALPGRGNNFVPMTQSDESQDFYNLKIELNDGELNFKEWKNNWGGTGFPSGTLIPDGNSIKILKGVYHVSLNLKTKEYKFSVVK